MSIVNFTIPLFDQYDGNESGYQRFVIETAWEAAMKTPASEHTLWPASGKEGAVIKVILTVHCNSIPHLKVERVTKIALDAISGVLWNPKYPPSKVTHVQIPWSKKSGIEVKIIQW